MIEWLWSYLCGSSKRKQRQAAKLRRLFHLDGGLRLPRSKTTTAISSVRCEVVVGGKKEILLLDVVLPRRFPGAVVVAALLPPQPLLTASKIPALMSSVLLLAPEPRSLSLSLSLSLSGCGRYVATAIAAETASHQEVKKEEEEESFLFKERMHLKKELATLNAIFKEQMARNENLKRIKLDLNLQCAKDSRLMSGVLEKAICSQPQQREPSSPSHISSLLPMHVPGDNTKLDSSETQGAISNHDRSFLLPDLNMMPSEDPHTETLPGMR
ncbi:hypothetical protein GH714_039460 [Hevea brasiliensis]|uniref:Uncharacterized protein n=1 Tax=Hevea brasiliensis TaxID=3981 RepID=A0A6A6KH73_HEVBR|nr:hypothetical protein GH714_039460 [Hevea brasiliensis]